MANRRERRAAEAAERKSDREFLKLADQFIDVANRMNETVPLPQVSAAIAHAAARYNAFAIKTAVTGLSQQEAIQAMVADYEQRLRAQLTERLSAGEPPPGRADEEGGRA